MSPNSVPSTSTRRLTEQMRCSGGKALPSWATTFMAGLPGTKRTKPASRFAIVIGFA